MDESSDIEEEEPHPRQRSQLPPPPSPSLNSPSSSSSSSSSSTPQRPCYPFGLVFFFDPTSKRSQIAQDHLVRPPFLPPLLVPSCFLPPPLHLPFSHLSSFLPLFLSQSTTSIEPPLVTKNIAEATHVIVGTSSFGESILRAQQLQTSSSSGSNARMGERGLPFVVNLSWFEKSIRNSMWEKEEEYLFVSSAGGEETEGEEGRSETVPEEMTR